MPAAQNRTIPDFMCDKGEFSYFKIAALLGLEYRPEDIDYHAFQVHIKNHKNSYTFKKELAPELVRSRYKVGNIYKHGRQELRIDSDEIAYFKINTSSPALKEKLIKEVLLPQDYRDILGEKLFNLQLLKDCFCYEIETENATLIIPSAAVAAHYYFRSSSLRKAVFSGNLKVLYSEGIKSKHNAMITLTSVASKNDALFVYRFATDEYAKDAFLDISRYIANKLAYNAKQRINTDSIPIKARFPAQEEFLIKLSFIKLTPGANGKDRLYVGRIVNDGSTFDFDELTVFKKEHRAERGEEPKKQLRIRGRKAKNILERTINRSPSKFYGVNRNFEIESEKAFGLDGKVIKYEKITIEDSPIGISMEKTKDNVSQSFAASSGSTQEKAIQTTIATKQSQEPPVERPPNFEIFARYVEFLEDSGYLDDIDYTAEYRDVPAGYNKNGSLTDRCSIDGKLKKYTTARFEYNGVSVVMLEVEAEKQDFATWLLMSATKEPTQAQIEMVLSLRYEEDSRAKNKKGLAIEELKERFSDFKILKFDRKNHPPGDPYDDDVMANWANTLLGKIV